MLRISWLPAPNLLRSLIPCLLFLVFAAGFWTFCPDTEPEGVLDFGGCFEGPTKGLVGAEVDFTNEL